LKARVTVIHELERRLRVTEQVIKFLTVRVDEEQKRLDKIKKLRDAKKKVSAQPAVVSGRSARPTRGSTGSRRARDGVKHLPNAESPGGTARNLVSRRGDCRMWVYWVLATGYWQLILKERYD
jgi:uncharacterized coiled-coil protein SlyX